MTDTEVKQDGNAPEVAKDSKTRESDVVEANPKAEDVGSEEVGPTEEEEVEPTEYVIEYPPFNEAPSESYVVTATLLGLRYQHGDVVSEEDLGGFENVLRFVNNRSIALAGTDAANVALLERKLAEQALSRYEKERGINNG